ncbi:FUSC family protein [Aeromicrobium duanguangcaii]|uniref:FUSC family protein n=1 Tax=Aeromicrobium duanguangcaii TaxID=2968086 RepID=A0ABY5KIJ2_9ACTN|nr:FUSC family protein [Aeromicrobium duanguangcaii]MCD9153621.1 FUSC family protein [Aeromicrobium duanguangcaii]MCL3836394.1 FUSC family protein [Aeromicrobium duanguangcaii]UUI69296.1 FUSC family protein [Aeromicrobium duanguangcaii]
MSGDRLPFRRLRLPRPEVTIRERLGRVRENWRLLLRLAVATGGAFTIATYLLGHAQAFFAPIAAVITMMGGAGRRQRVVFELVLGVAFGVLVAELLILLIGRGGWQMALVASLTAIVAMLFNLRGMALTQAINSGVLLAAIVPVAGHATPAVTRFTDALIGGMCGFVMMLVLPRNTKRDIDASLQQLLRGLADVLDKIAQAMRTDDAALADAALTEARDTQPIIESLYSTAANVSEIARLAPLRWSQRADIERYAGSVDDLDNAMRDARVLARRVAAMLRHDEKVPTGLTDAVEILIHAVQIYGDEFASAVDLARANDRLVEASDLAMRALPGRLTVNTASVAAQVRSLAADLLMAGGVPRTALDDILDVD